VAVGVPNLAALTELEGAFSLSNLNLLCPALIDVFLNYSKGYGRLMWKLIRDIVLILIGLIFGTVGCTVAMILSELNVRRCRVAKRKRKWKWDRCYAIA